MKIIEYNQSPNVALEEALNLMKQGDTVLLTVQDLNSSLICAPNQVAAEKMEAIKERTRGSRNFGFMIGEVQNFLNIVEEGTIPNDLRDPTKFEKLFQLGHVNCIVNPDESYNTIVVRDGTVQGCLISNEYSKEYRDFFKQVEKGLVGHNDQSLIGGKTYCATLATSANMHGQGNITDRAKAVEFGKSRGIKLCINFKPKSDNLDFGAYSIFKFRPDSIQAIRKGASHNKIMKSPAMSNMRVQFAKKTIEELADIMTEDVDFNTVHSIYKQFDANDDEGLDENEFNSFVKYLKGVRIENISEKDTKALFKAIDIDSNGSISFLEFVHFLEDAYDGYSPHLKKLVSKFIDVVRKRAAVSDSVSVTDNVQHILKAFEIIDTDKSDSCERPEFGAFLRNGGFTKTEVDVLFELIDMTHNGDGSISFTELIAFLQTVEESIASGPTTPDTAKSSTLDISRSRRESIRSNMESARLNVENGIAAVVDKTSPVQGLFLELLEQSQYQQKQITQQQELFRQIMQAQHETSVMMMQQQHQQKMLLIKTLMNSSDDELTADKK